MIDVVKHKQNKNPLSVIDLLLLNEFDGKQENYEIPAYRIDEFGRDYLKRVENLMSDGYLKFSSTEESLNSLTIPTMNILTTAASKNFTEEGGGKFRLSVALLIFSLNFYIGFLL